MTTPPATHTDRPLGAPPLGARPEGTTDTASAGLAVQAMFDTIAPKYDRLNHVLSLGMDRVWWARAAKQFDPILRNPQSNVLDLCCGTADMTAALLARRPTSQQASAAPQSHVPHVPPLPHGIEPLQHSAAPAPITAIDFSHEMIERGRRKLAGKPVLFLEADALHLLLEPASQDLVTSAFGFRNLADYNAGLREIRRVLRTGGAVGILDFSEPKGLLGDAYRLYFRHVLPRIGGLLSGSGASYRYLPASVERFPSPDEMCRMMQRAGFTEATWQPYLFGVAGLWSATAA